MGAFVVIILSFIGLYVLSGIKIVNQYQRGVVLTLGKFTGVREPGLSRHSRSTNNDVGRYSFNSN